MSVFNLLKKTDTHIFCCVEKLLEIPWILYLETFNQPGVLSQQTSHKQPAHLPFRRQLCRLKLSLKTLIENIHWNHCRVFNLVLHYVLNFLDSLIINYHRCHIISQQRNRYMQGCWPLFLTIDLITLDFPF